MVSDIDLRLKINQMHIVRLNQSGQYRMVLLLVVILMTFSLVVVGVMTVAPSATRLAR